MKRITIAGASFFAVLLCAMGAAGQERWVNVEQGAPGELKGVAKIFVFADKGDKAKIVGEIRKRLPLLTIVGNSEAAEVWIAFRVNSHVPANNPTSQLGSTRGMSSTSADYEIAVTGYVMKPIAANRVRRLIEFKDSRRSAFQAEMAARFARIFVESYESANK